MMKVRPLVPLVPSVLNLGRLEAEDNSRYIRQGPLTLQQVLGKAWLAMEAEEEAERRRADPYFHLRAARRRTLLGRLLHGG